MSELARFDMPRFIYLVFDKQGGLIASYHSLDKFKVAYHYEGSYDLVVLEYDDGSFYAVNEISDAGDFLHRVQNIDRWPEYGQYVDYNKHWGLE